MGSRVGGRHRLSSPITRPGGRVRPRPSVAPQYPLCWNLRLAGNEHPLILDGSGAVLRERRVGGEAGARARVLMRNWRLPVLAGRLALWLHTGPKVAGLPIVLLKTRQRRAATRAILVEADRTDARVIASVV